MEPKPLPPLPQFDVVSEPPQRQKTLSPANTRAWSRTLAKKISNRSIPQDTSPSSRQVRRAEARRAAKANKS